MENLGMMGRLLISEYSLVIANRWSAHNGSFEAYRVTEIKLKTLEN